MILRCNSSWELLTRWQMPCLGTGRINPQLWWPFLFYNCWIWRTLSEGSMGMRSVQSCSLGCKLVNYCGKAIVWKMGCCSMKKGWCCLNCPLGFLVCCMSFMTRWWVAIRGASALTYEFLAACFSREWRRQFGTMLPSAMFANAPRVRPYLWRGCCSPTYSKPNLGWYLHGFYRQATKVWGPWHHPYSGRPVVQVCPLLTPCAPFLASK